MPASHSPLTGWGLRGRGATLRMGGCLAVFWASVGTARSAVTACARMGLAAFSKALRLRW